MIAIAINGAIIDMNSNPNKKMTKICTGCRVGLSRAVMMVIIVMKRKMSIDQNWRAC
jgi:hypothetical protein